MTIEEQYDSLPEHLRAREIPLDIAEAFAYLIDADTAWQPGTPVPDGVDYELWKLTRAGA